MRHTENENTKTKFTALLEWLEDVRFNGPADIQCQIMNMLEAWLSTDYANKPSDRNAYYHDSKLVAQGMAIIGEFTKEDFETLQNLIQPSHVS